MVDDGEHRITYLTQSHICSLMFIYNLFELNFYSDISGSKLRKLIWVHQDEETFKVWLAISGIVSHRSIVCVSDNKYIILFIFIMSWCVMFSNLELKNYQDKRFEFI